MMPFGEPSRITSKKAWLGNRISDARFLIWKLRGGKWVKPGPIDTFFAKIQLKLQGAPSWVYEDM